ncbi:hypothetical protein VNI00_016315 [Paramarasmius palmivorus]|uniref:Uncharacterized protein n=1 Tax=Paramarasmius palmivorus TaxID=297713 RepID=A0AAW0BEF4_9AGAR
MEVRDAYAYFRLSPALTPQISIEAVWNRHVRAALASDPVVAARRKRRKEEKKGKAGKESAEVAAERDGNGKRYATSFRQTTGYIDSDRGPGNDVSMEAPSTTPIGTTFPQDAGQSSTSVASRSGSKREAEVIEITDSEQEDGDIDAEAESPLLRQAGRSFVSSHRSTEGFDEWHF